MLNTITAESSSPVMTVTCPAKRSNAETVQVGPSTKMSDFPIHQDLGRRVCKLGTWW